MDKKKLDKTEAHAVVVRRFEPSDKLEVQRIFYEGMMEMVSDTAFTGLRHHPESLLLYTFFTIVCFVITKCWWVIGLLPVCVLCARYLYSRSVIYGYLDHALQRDMGDVEGFYMKSPESCLWVALLEGKVVGVVAAVGHQIQRGTLELQRMSVDRNCRRRGVGMLLGRKVLEYAIARGYSTVVLGTTAYNLAAHKLYQSLGFCCVGVTNGYIAPGTRQSVLGCVFYRVCHYHYSLDVQSIKSKLL